MLKRFVTPFSAAEEEPGVQQIDSVDALNAAVASAQEQSTEDAEPSSETTEPQGTEQQQEPQSKPTPDEKKEYAFAQQQHEISELTALLGKVAEANGIKFENKKDLMNKLNDSAIESMAQKQGVPAELLREMEQLKNDAAQWKRYQHEQSAAQGFKAVQDEYNLTQDQLNSFAVELDAAGLNPFTQNVNVLNEYKIRHFDDIVQAKIQAGIEAALRNDGAANQNSSTPSSMQGASGSTLSPDKVDTVAKLNALLRG